MKTLSLIILAGVLAGIIGLYIGTVRSYGFFSETIEQRVIRDANSELLRVGVRKYELACDSGTVMVIRRQ